jgi:hypothetical protein
VIKIKRLYILLAVACMALIVLYFQYYKRFKLQQTNQSNEQIDFQLNSLLSKPVGIDPKSTKTCNQLAEEDLNFAKDLCKQKSDSLKYFCADIVTGILNKADNEDDCDSYGFQYATICPADHLYFMTLSFGGGTEGLTIPDTINSLSHLHTLKINGIPLSNISSITNKHIESLDLFSDLKDQDIQSFKAWLGNLVNLSSLSLGITNNSKNFLPEEITKLSHLEKLTLGNWNSKIELVIPNWIFKLTNVEELEFRGAKFDENFSALSKLNKLQSLTFYDLKNHEIPQLNSNLTSLIINSGQVDTIPDWIGNLMNLITLRIIDTKIKSLPESLGSLSNLQELSVSGHIRNPLENLPESLGKLSQLRE